MSSMLRPSRAILACAIGAVVPVAQAAGASAGSGASPCAAQYAEWITEPDEFIRHDQPRHMQGLHVLCVWRPSGANSGLRIEAYMNAVGGRPPIEAELPSESERSWSEFRRQLKSALGFRRRSNDWSHQRLKQPFGIFSESGKRLGSPGEVVEARVVFVIEGGQWYWPPIKVGHVRELPGTSFQLETLSVQPVIYRVRGFLRDRECTEIVKLGAGRMVSSPVSLMDKDKGKSSKEFRTSTQARIDRHESTTLQDIDRRIAALTRVPIEHNEEVQILRYRKAEYYSAHLDNWDPAFYTGGDSAFIEYGHNNRMITVFWYLTNVTEGGETHFPRTNGRPQPNDMWMCDGGMKVRPEQGTVIFWYSLHPNGNTDPNGLHAACPVKTGEKWSANYWVWNKPRHAEAMPDEGVDNFDAESDEHELRGIAQATPGQPVVASFANKHASETVYLFWRRPETGEEVPMGSLAPGARTHMSTFAGHSWTIRAGASSSSKLVSEFEMQGGANQEHVVHDEM